MYQYTISTYNGKRYVVFADNVRDALAQVGYATSHWPRSVHRCAAK